MRRHPSGSRGDRDVSEGGGKHNNTMGGGALSTQGAGRGGGHHQNSAAGPGHQHGGAPKRGGHSAPLRGDYNYVDRQKPQNRRPSTARQVASQHLNVVYFSAQNDISQPWFHRNISREAAVLALQSATAGTFLIRPSSQRGNYALSWLDHDGRVRYCHAIYGPSSYSLT